MADVSFIKPSSCLVLMEHFTDLKQLQDTINCSNKFTELLKANARAKDEVGDHETQPFSESCLVHRRKQRDLFCQQCAEEICRDCIADHFNHCCTESSTVIHEEIRRVGDAAADVTELLGEMKQEISRVKEMKQSVKNNYDKNITVTKEVFATLRKAIDEQEEQILMDIKMESSKREKCLQLQLESLVLLWSQLKSCLEVMRKTREEEPLKVVDLINKRKTLEQRRDHLMMMKRRSKFEPFKKIEPVMKEQEEIMFEGMERLHQEVNKLRPEPLDQSKLNATVPLLIVNKENSLMIKVRDMNNDLVSQSLHFSDNNEAIAIKELGCGTYKLTFVPSKCGNYVMSILANGQHIPGSPYKIPVDRDYSKITEQNCRQVVTCFGRDRLKFCCLNDVAIGGNGEIIIVDNGNRCVLVLDHKFDLLRVIGQGDLNNKLVRPVGVAVTDNTIAVSDQYLCQVKKYSLQGKLVSVMGSSGTGVTQFFNPKGLVFNSNKHLYVLDGGNHRVQVFLPDDTFSFSFGNEGLDPGQFQFPGRIAIDPSDNVLVSDNFSNCIHLFNDHGRFIKKIDCYRPWAIAVSATGYIITVDDDIITIWSPTHCLIHQFGRIGSQKGEFIGIRGMAVGSTGDIYVVEGYNKRLQVITG